MVSVGKFHESHPTNLLSSMDDHGENIVPFEYVRKPNICRTKPFFTKKVSIEVLFDPESKISQRNPFLSRVDLSHLFFVWEMYVASERESNSYQIYFLNV